MQEDLVASKPGIESSIEELTKLLPTLQQSVHADISAAEERGKEEAIKVSSLNALKQGRTCMVGSGSPE